MILAAGRGQRMRPLTDRTPKPLLCVGGKPLIVWHLELIKACGWPQVVINHAHLGQQIEQALGDGRRFGLKIIYSAESELLDTAGGIAQALPSLTGEGQHCVFVINGDVFCRLQIADVHNAIQTFIQGTDLAHLWWVDNPSHNTQGDFAYINGRLKSQICVGDQAVTFAGLGLYRPSLFANLPRGQPMPLGPVLRQAMQVDKVSAQPLLGQWVDVGTPERLQQLDALLQRQDLSILGS
jgi:MurNAc alpha-1-phosphate uridylyltransferase